MKQFLFYLVMFVSVTGKAQTIHTFYIDSTHTTSNWPAPPSPCPSDTSFMVSNGDTLYFINHLYATMFNLWMNDPNLTGAPTMSTWPVNINDTIIRFAVVNDTTYHILVYNNVFYSSIAQLPNIVILNGTAGWGRRYFITHNSTNSISESDLLNNLLIYPVPANNFLNVNGIKENQTQFYLFDLSGKLIKKGLLNNGSIDIEFLDSGTYFIKFSGMEKSYKFIKN